MLIIGAGGFAKELLQIFHQKDQITNIAFYDDIHSEIFQVFGRFPVLKNEEEVKKHFEDYGNSFVLGLGNPFNRFKMYKKFTKVGGKLSSSISLFSRIGNYSVTIDKGTNILDNAIVSNNVSIGKGCLIYYQAVVTHDCVLNNFVEISPGAMILGRSKIDSFTQIGAQSTILPDITIGKNVIVGAGSVVTKSIPERCIVAGVPAKIIGSNKNYVVD